MKKCINTLLAICCALTANAQWNTICNTGNGFVVDMLWYNDSIYSAGFFTHDCNTSANYINRNYHLGTWQAVDTGLPDPGHRMRVIDNELYVAKYQQAVDSNWLYKWGGSHFQKFGASLYLTTAVAGFSKTPSVYDVAQYHGDIIISGEFDRADGKHISGIARWTGSTWDSLGTGLSGSLDASNVMYPHQMVVYNDTLYVVGNFTTAGGIITNGVAKWDGAQWHAMGSGFNKDVYAIAVYNNVLYAGGGFTMSGSTVMHHIAMWDGSNWVDPGMGVYTDLTTSDPNAYVHTIKQIGSYLFVTGGFTHAISASGTQTCGNIIAWNGTQVNTLSGGTPNYQIEGVLDYGTHNILASGGYNNDSSYIGMYNIDGLAVPVQGKGNNEISIYPVPASDVLHIDGLVRGSDIALFDMPGKQVLSGIAQGEQATLDISALPAGTYLMKISANGAAPVAKMVVKQ